MKTDREKLVELLTEFGVEFTEDGLAIRLDAKSRKVEGYTCFFAEFRFDARGKFVNAGVWE